MKKLIIALAAAACLFAGCESDDAPKTSKVGIQLTVDGKALAQGDVTITLSDGTNSFETKTDETGLAELISTFGNYTASTSFKVYGDDNTYTIYNGTSSVQISAETSGTTFKLPLSAAKTSSLIIKEVYGGGCTYDNNGAAKTYQTDKFIVLYNNSDKDIDLADVCVGAVYPSNNWASNKYYSENTMTYFAEKWIPEGWAFWGFKTEGEGGRASYTLAPYSQVVISLYGAIDHTVSINTSVDLSNADYVMYDPESGLNLKSYYPAPSENIPSTNYMKAYKFANSTAWATSYGTPGLFIFKMNAADATAFIADDNNKDFTNGAKLPTAKIPESIVLDATEQAYTGSLSATKPRFPSSIDAGYVKHTPYKSHSLYRNVDLEATLAIEGNKDLLVYGYAGGTASEEYGSTDPSGVDAEASIKKGAKIVFKDTNNSTNDFHQRAKSTLTK